MGVILIILNIADSILTHYAVFTLNVKELNPLNGYFMNTMIKWWWIPKLIIIVVGVMLLVKYYNKFLLARIGLIVVSIVYLFVLMWHIYGFYQLYSLGLI